MPVLYAKNEQVDVSSVMNVRGLLDFLLTLFILLFIHTTKGFFGYNAQSAIFSSIENCINTSYFYLCTHVATYSLGKSIKTFSFLL